MVGSLGSSGRGGRVTWVAIEPWRVIEEPSLARHDELSERTAPRAHGRMSGPRFAMYDCTATSQRDARLKRRAHESSRLDSFSPFANVKKLVSLQRHAAFEPARRAGLEGSSRGRVSGFARTRRRWTPPADNGRCGAFPARPIWAECPGSLVMKGDRFESGRRLPIRAPAAAHPVRWSAPPSPRAWSTRPPGFVARPARPRAASGTAVGPDPRAARTRLRRPKSLDRSSDSPRAAPRSTAMTVPRVTSRRATRAGEGAARDGRLVMRSRGMALRTYDIAAAVPESVNPAHSSARRFLSLKGLTHSAASATSDSGWFWSSFCLRRLNGRVRPSRHMYGPSTS